MNKEQINLVNKRDKVVFEIWVEGNKLKARHSARTPNGGLVSEVIDITTLWNFFKQVNGQVEELLGVTNE